MFQLEEFAKRPLSFRFRVRRKLNMVTPACSLAISLHERYGTARLPKSGARSPTSCVASVTWSRSTTRMLLLGVREKKSSIRGCSIIQTDRTGVTSAVSLPKSPKPNLNPKLGRLRRHSPSVLPGQRAPDGTCTAQVNTLQQQSKVAPGFGCWRASISHLSLRSA
jgi:hypothetical protein